MGQISKPAPHVARGLRQAPKWRRWDRIIGPLAARGIAIVLAVLLGFGLWASIACYRSGLAAGNATDISDAFQEARYAVGAEESLERKYRLEQDPADRTRHRAAAAAMVSALGRARDLGVDAGLLDGTLSAHTRYLASIDRLFEAVDEGNRALITAIDGTEADPAFDSLQDRILAAAQESRAHAQRERDHLARMQASVLIGTPIVSALSLGLGLFFWRAMRTYRCWAEAAILREATATRLREQRLRALVQNAADLILICDASGFITYQSPAAEISWGYGGDALLGQPFVTLVHPDAAPAVRELWHLVNNGAGTFTAGTTRNTELSLLDSAGEWRCVQLIFTSLLHEPAVAGVVATIHDIRERKALEQQLTRQAFHDALTGLPNRLLFQDRLRQALVRARRRGSRVGLLFLDLDNFKLINDSLGHQVGDDLLVQAAVRLKDCVRAEDTVARLGGDEFVVVLENLSSEADAMPVAEAIATRFSRAFLLGGRELTVTASVGIAVGRVGLDDADNLLRDADVAMYRAKSDGRARYVLFDASMYTDTLARLELENDLRRAIPNGELRVYYQPIVLMTPGNVGEIEALVRWQHPTRGLVQPSEFIEIAEETGLIVPLGRWVLREACRQVALWHKQFPTDPPLIVNVNLSPRQFQLPTLVEEVAQTLRETGLPADCLKLEITEGVIMRDAEATISTLWRLKDLGIKLAIDDFGTGYSSLAYLKRLPMDVLKIDRSFVAGLGRDQEDTAIVRAIISLAKSLDLLVTGEGIETREQAALLGAWGCDRGQGYYYGKPIDSAGTAALLRDATQQQLEVTAV